MADQQQHDHDKHERPDVPAPGLAELGKRGLARRRVAKAGLGATGVLWSLESKATGLICKTPSAFYSNGVKNKSNSPQKRYCAGWPPIVWCAIGTYWPCSDKIMFNNVFRCTTSKTQKVYGKASLRDVLKGVSGDDSGLGAQMAAAYLNVLSRQINVVDEQDLLKMWRDIQRGGYEVSPNVLITWRELSDYLKSTHY